MYKVCTKYVQSMYKVCTKYVQSSLDCGDPVECKTITNVIFCFFWF